MSDSLNETNFICASAHFNEKNDNKTLHAMIAYNAVHNMNCFPFTKKTIKSIWAN